VDFLGNVERPKLIKWLGDVRQSARHDSACGGELRRRRAGAPRRAERPEKPTQLMRAQTRTPVVLARVLLHKSAGQFAGGGKMSVTEDAEDAGERGHQPRFPRPTRNEAEQDPEAFYRFIAYLCARPKKRLQVNHIADALGCDKGTASRKLSAKKLSADERGQVLADIYHRRLIYGSWIEEVQEVPHHLFYSMMAFYGIKENSQDNARGAIAGTYRLWRYSSDLEGEFVHGRIDIEEDHKNPVSGDDEGVGALRVKIRQIRKPGAFQRGTDEVLDGYFFRISNMYTLLVRQQLTHNFRSTIFKDFRTDVVGKNVNKKSIYKANTEHVVSLDGFAMGMDANLLFFSPVYVELVDDKDEIDRLDSELDVVPESKVPGRILQKLKRYPRIVR
jgi:hypothetical protein